MNMERILCNKAEMKVKMVENIKKEKMILS